MLNHHQTSKPLFIVQYGTVGLKTPEGEHIWPWQCWLKSRCHVRSQRMDALSYLKEKSTLHVLSLVGDHVIKTKELCCTMCGCVPVWSFVGADAGWCLACWQRTVSNVLQYSGLSDDGSRRSVGWQRLNGSSGESLSDTWRHKGSRAEFRGPNTHMQGSNTNFRGRSQVDKYNNDTGESHLFHSQA